MIFGPTSFLRIGTMHLPKNVVCTETNERFVDTLMEDGSNLTC